jgi:thioredoxin:protein disulfide reductase
MVEPPARAGLKDRMQAFMQSLRTWLTRAALVVGVLAATFTGLPTDARAAEDFLPPEEAFRMEVRALDARTVEIAFRITEGYYLYREQFKFAAEQSGVTLGAPQIPPGKIKFDETFQKDVESYRQRIAIRLPVEAAPASFKLKVISQGCADAGLCYPPMTSMAEVRLAGFGGDGSARALLAVDGPVASTPSTGLSGTSGDDVIDRAMRGGSGWVIVGVFFIAGLLLSFTPCVLPMLPILSSIIVGGAGAQAAGGTTGRGRGLMLAATYSLGMALIYTVLGVAAGLAGEGLAAALQKPWVLISFAAVLAVLALAMFGAYELQLPAAWRDKLSASSGRLQGGHLAGVFAMGGLSALIVSPCVAAPLAGALIYISQTRDVLLGGTALFSLAAGMSVPLLLLGASAGVLLPRAGAWMDRVKQVFGVLLLAVAWWILSPVLPAAVAVAGWGALLLLAASFLGAFDALSGTAGAPARVSKAVGLAMAVAGAVQIVGAAAGAEDGLRPLQPFARSAEAVMAASSVVTSTLASADAPAAPQASTHVRFQRVRSLDDLNERLRTADRPVMLDFYADWCVSCKEMERFTFTDPAVRQRLASVLLLQADVTRNNDADRALLKRFGLFGPPGIVFFDQQGQEKANVRVIGYQNPQRFAQSLQAAGL